MYIIYYIYIGFREKITKRFTTISFTISRSSGKSNIYIEREQVCVHVNCLFVSKNLGRLNKQVKRVLRSDTVELRWTYCFPLIGLPKKSLVH